MIKKALSNPDAIAALIFISFGMAGLILIAGFEFGTLNRMGPAYFPSIVSILLILVGLKLSWDALRCNKQEISWGNVRPIICVLGAMFLFAILIKSIGLVIASLGLITLVYSASGKISLKQVSLISFVLITFNIVVFVTILRMPLKLWPEF